MTCHSIRIICAAAAINPFATLVILPANTVLAAAICEQGYVWRDAADGDGVCVTPEEREIAKLQNASATNNRQKGGGAYGPNTCRQGYVWREAFSGDVACVTPHERSEAQRQNKEGPLHQAK
jgi:hypothetical protein